MASPQGLPIIRALIAGLGLLAASAAHAQLNLTGILRSVTGAVAPEQKPQVQQGLTTTMGVRGIDDVQTAPVSSAGADIKQLDNWVATPEAAQAFAGRTGLLARPVRSCAQAANYPGAPEAKP